MQFFSWPRNRQRSRPGGNIRSHASTGKRATFRPQLEALEDRCVPSTLTVTNNLDGPVGSLRYEIATAHNGDTIVFASSLKGQTITLGGSQLEITKNLDIEGLGAGNLRISGGNRSRVFDVSSSSATVTLAGMTITGGNGFPAVGASTVPPADPNGGGILNFGTLTVSNSTISYNGSAGGAGGGIGNYGTLTVTYSTISHNSAGAFGGGIYSAGGLTVSSCTVSNNFAWFGGGIYSAGGLTVSSCTISGNSADAGGGIYNELNATLSNSTISGNTAYDGGGGISNGFGSLTVSSCTVSYNQALYGGGIYNYWGDLTVIYSVVLNNVAPLWQGADIYDVIINGYDGLNLINSTVGVIDYAYVYLCC